MNNGSEKLRLTILQAIVILFAIIVGLAVYDHPSFTPDDGIYAYQASLLSSPTSADSNAPPQNVSYITLFNAALLKTFGDSLVSLRIGLLLLMAVNACLAFRILMAQSKSDAVIGSVTFTCVSVPMFVSPSANWLCITALLAIWKLCTVERLSLGRILFIGSLAGLAFHTRTLSGLAILSGALVVVIGHPGARGGKDGSRPVSLFVLVPLLTTAIFMSFRALSIGSWLMFASPAVAVLLNCLTSLKAESGRAFREIVCFSTGVVLASLPVLVYLVLNGWLVAWINETFIQTPRISWQEFSGYSTYSELPLLVIEGLIRSPDLVVGANSFFWLTLLLAPAMVGALYYFKTADQSHYVKFQPVVLVLVFAITGLHLQIPVYLFYVSSLCVLGIFTFQSELTKVSVRTVRIIAIIVSLTGLCFHAGKPIGPNLDSMLRGDRNIKLSRCNLNKLGLELPTAECKEYVALVAAIENGSREHESVLPIPNEVVLNFLTERNYPFRSATCPFEIYSRNALNSAVNRLRKTPPKILIVDPTDKYYSDLCRELVNTIIKPYTLTESIGPRRVYVLTPD